MRLLQRIEHAYKTGTGNYGHCDNIDLNTTNLGSVTAFTPAMSQIEPAQKFAQPNGPHRNGSSNLWEGLYDLNPRVPWYLSSNPFQNRGARSVFRFGFDATMASYADSSSYCFFIGLMATPTALIGKTYAQVSALTALTQLIGLSNLFGSEVQLISNDGTGSITTRPVPAMVCPTDATTAIMHNVFHFSIDNSEPTGATQVQVLCSYAHASTPGYVSGQMLLDTVLTANVPNPGNYTLSPVLGLADTMGLTGLHIQSIEVLVPHY